MRNKTKGFFLGVFMMVLIAAIGIGAFHVYKKIQSQKEDAAIIICKIDNLKNGDKFTVGDKIGVRLRANSDKKLVKLFYVINGDRTNVDSVSGETGTFEKEKTIGNKKYSIDSGVFSIDTTLMNAGAYALVAYAEDESGETYLFNENAIVFTIIEAVAEPTESAK